MRTYVSRLNTTIIATAVALLLFGAFTMLFGTVAGTATAAPVAETVVEPQANVPIKVLPAAAALRAISIPYGISDILTISVDGGQLLATGHAVCWDDGQMFDLKVRVAQSTTNAYAIGQSIDICANGERQMWDANTAAQSVVVFEAGGARACAEATEYGKHGITDEYQWCKDIELTTE